MTNLGPYGYIGGYNNAALAYELGRDQLSDGQNVQIVYATLQKLKGSANVNTTALNSAAAISGLYDWLANAGTRYQLIVAGNKLFQTANLGNTPTDITGATTITAGANNQHTFSSLNNIVVLCGGATPDAPIQWTGTGNAASLSGSPPSGSLTVTANNFVFISGVSATPSRVYWSNVGDPQTWPAASFVDFRPGDGDTVTALADLNQNLVIFKRRSLGILYTQTNTTTGSVTLAPLTQFPSKVGCAGSQAWDHLPDGRIIFMGSDAHAYIFDGGTLTDISDRPYPLGAMQPLFDALPASRIPYVAVQVYQTKHQIWFSVSTGSNTTNNQIYAYDYVHEIWEPPFTNINANVLRAVIDTRSTPSHTLVMCTGTYGGFVTEQDKGNTNVEAPGTAIDAYGTISVILGPDQEDFEPKALIVPYEGQSVTTLTNISYGFNGYTATGTTYQIQMQQTGDLLDSTFVLDTSTLAGDTIQRSVIPIQNTGRTYSM